jgi:hypothetical protein
MMSAADAGGTLLRLVKEVPATVEELQAITEY